MKYQFSSLRSPSWAYLAIGAVITIIAVAYIGISVYVATQVVARNHRELTIPASQIAPNYKEISFKTVDNLSLQGWLFPNSGPNLVILVAGYGNTRVDDDYSGPDLMRDLISHGYSVLVYDARGVGRSEGQHITQADHEWRDVVAAVKFANQQGYPSQHIGIIAASMGATTVADNVDQFKDVGAIILDTPAKRFTEPVSHALANEKGVPHFLHPGIYFAAKILYGIDISDVQPIKHIQADPNRTLLFLHATNDPLIPVQDSRDLLALSNASSQLVEFNTDQHIKTYGEFPELYLSSVVPFLEQQLADN